MTIRVVTAEQAARRDLAAIAAGTSSRELMRRAGEGAAHVILRRFAGPLAAQGSALVVCGTGNNGGDGWVVASVLQQRGLNVFTESLGEAKTPDAAWARTLASPRPVGSHVPSVVVDALLGTGARGAPRGAVATAIARIAEYRARGAHVVSLDLPSGVDADAGAADLAVHADLTIAMGNVKRGHLLARDHCGQVLALDIGVSNEADSDGAPALIDAAWVRARIPSFPAAAHKGTRKRLLLVGAAHGMAGALAYATRAALRSGIGMVRCCCALESIPSLQALVPQATTAPWPAPNEVDSALAWPHALLIGPGLGADAGARSRAQMWLRAWRGPVVVDADGLGCFGPDVDALGALLAGRPAIVTPHATEAARLLGTTAADVLARRFDLAADLARHLNATVLLKGVPTLVAAGDGTRGVIARGTPVLAQGGSGDVLAGIGATLLAQLGDAPNAAACAAFVHGRAAEIATAGRTVRGVTLDDVVVALGQVWRLDDDPIAEGELAWLPGVGAAR